MFTSKNSFFPCTGARAFHAPMLREFVHSPGASLGGAAFTALMAGRTPARLALPSVVKSA